MSKHGTRWGARCETCSLDKAMCLGHAPNTPPAIPASEAYKDTTPESSQPLTIDALDRMLRDIRRRRAALARRDEGRAA